MNRLIDQFMEGAQTAAEGLKQGIANVSQAATATPSIMYDALDVQIGKQRFGCIIRDPITFPRVHFILDGEPPFIELDHDHV